MKTRLGKIAQLPKPIRDDLNHRLENGKQSPELLEWLNSLPETKDLITQKFDNQPITKSNLSDWRHGGFEEWRADQLREARIHRICETGDTLAQAETSDLFENFARMTAAEMLADLDGLQKLRGEKRSQHLNNLVRNLARLQNSYNRSRWAELAWVKYKDTDSGTGVSPVRCSPQLETQNSQPETSNATPSPSTPVACRAEALAKADASASSPSATSSAPPSIVPDRAASQAMDPDDPEPKPNGNNMYVLHFPDCSCGELCPQCHAPDSNYPLADALRDDRYHRKYHRYPRDRHGKERFLINVVCSCPCERCAEKAGVRPSPAAATCSAKPLSNLPSLASESSCARDGRTPQSNPIIHHAESRDETPTVETNLATPPTPPLAIRPICPIRPIPPAQLTDFSRRMALLKTASCNTGEVARATFT